MSDWLLHPGVVRSRWLAGWAILGLTLSGPGCSGGRSTADDPPDGNPVEGEGELTDGGLPDGAVADAGRPEQVIPPERCRQPPFPEVRFARVTDAWGIGRAGLAVDGLRVMAAELDGDGYPDLVIHGRSNEREAPGEQPPAEDRWVLFNRPAARGTGRSFVDGTRTSGVFALRGGGQGRIAHLAVAGDVDNDGDLDLFSGNYTDTLAADDQGDRSEMLLNQGDGTFLLGPEWALGERKPRPTTAAAFLDYDLDGILDLFLGGFAVQNELYRGRGDGRFDQLTHQAGLTVTPGGEAAGTNARPSQGVTVCDVNGDRLPDLLVSSVGRQANQLWLGSREGRFVEVADRVGYAGDANQDYQDHQAYHCFCQSSGSCAAPAPRIDCTPGRWSWTPGVDDQPWHSHGDTFTTVCGDLDGDDRLDLVSAELRHWWTGEAADRTELLRQVADPDLLGFHFDRPGNTVTGLHRTWRSSEWSEGDVTASFMDFDGDGLPDLCVGSTDQPGNRAFLWRQRGGGFQEVALEVGLSHPWALSHAWADLDRDGDPDLVVTSSDQPGGEWTNPEVHVYENQGAEARNWLQVRLVGRGAGHANRAAIGARVIVETGVRRQVQEVSGGYGHFGLQHGLELRFGLGSTCTVDRLTVRWPDGAGTTEVFEQVRANYQLEIRQGEGVIRYVE